MQESTINGGTEFFTASQRTAQDHHADPARATRIATAGMRESLNEEQMHFLESLPFFFLATSDGAGNVQCSFKGGGAGVIHVPNPCTLVYPEFAGNDMMLSVGNLAAAPAIGILALRFDPARRLRIQGLAHIGEAPPNNQLDARLWVHVEITRVFGNCARHIPPLTTPVID